MKNKTKSILATAALGFIIGVFTGLLISIIVSFFAGDGLYHAITPSFAKTVSSELTGTIISFTLCGVLGMVNALASYLFSNKERTYLQNSMIHLPLTMIPLVLIARYLHWFNIDNRGLLTYTAIYLAIYAVIWAVFYLSQRKEVDTINAKLQR